MKFLIFLGPPGVGKGTQCALLSSRLKVKHISTGTIIRNEISSGSDLGVNIKNTVESGKLVEDQTVFKCLVNALNQSCSSFEKDQIILLDGIPRNLNQADQLNQILAGFNAKVNGVISLTANEDQLVSRFEHRWTCSSCSYVSSIATSAEVDIYKCPQCGIVGSMFRRKDDEPNIVRERFSIYQRETFPLIKFYESKNLLFCIDGLAIPEIVYIKIASILLKI